MAIYKLFGHPNGGEAKIVRGTKSVGTITRSASGEWFGRLRIKNQDTITARGSDLYKVFDEIVDKRQRAEWK